MTFLVHDVYVNAEPLLNAYCKNKNNHFVGYVLLYEWKLSLLNFHVFVMKISLISGEVVWCFKYKFFVLIHIAYLIYVKIMYEQDFSLGFKIHQREMTHKMPLQ